MSLRWKSYIAPYSRKRGGGLKKAKRSFSRVKLHFTWRKFATKFLCVNTVGDKVVRHSLSYLSVQKWFAGTSLARNWPTPWKCRFLIDYRSYASAVTSCEKSWIISNRKSTTRFAMSLRWTACVAPKPQKGAQKRSVQNLHDNMR